MDKQAFSALFEDVQKALKEQRLSDAILALEGLIMFTGNWNAKTDLSEIQDSYGMLLDYMARGFVDPDRDSLLRQFLKRTYELADVTYRDYLLLDNQSHYASVWSILQKMSQPCSLNDLLNQGGSYRQLFEVSWTGPIWQKDDYEAAHAIMESTKWAQYERCVLVSGVTMGALQVFDVQRLNFLMDLAVSPVVGIRVRAFVGVVLVYMKYADRCRLYPEITAQLRLMADIPGFVTMLQNLQVQFFLSLETDKIEKKLHDEIFPEVMKDARELHMNKSLGFEELQAKLMEQDFNPEWGKDGEVSKLERKMKEFVEMQKKGVDVYIGSFKMLKQRFPFFNVAANWFCPFSFEHPEVNHVIEDNPMVKMFLKRGNLCDSDKYTFCWMLQTISVGLEDLLKKEMDNALNEYSDGVPDADLDKEINDPTCVLRYYIQDLYRYFTLFRYRDNKENPFDLNLVLMDYPPFDEILCNESSMQEFADFTFKEKSYLYALNFYEHLPESAENLQKIGFCHQSVKNYQQAIVAYEKANLMKSDSVWTLRQLGMCYRSVGNFKKALRAYEELELKSPEDISLLLRLSECYLHEEMYDQAFEKLYKADYLAPESGMAIRALAWCSLLTGKIEQACGYYDKILKKSPSSEDYFNAGHAAWLSGNIQQAIAYYREYVTLKKLEFVPSDFFGEDSKLLMKKGKKLTDLRLMVDILNKK